MRRARAVVDWRGSERRDPRFLNSLTEIYTESRNPRRGGAGLWLEMFSRNWIGIWLVTCGLLGVACDGSPVDAETPPSFGRTALRDGDVLFCSGAGGSGWGDPIERPAQAVARDVASGLLSVEAALQLYGVALGSGGSVDDTLTEERRAGMRRQRLEAAEVDQRLAQVVGALPAACGRCGEGLGGGVKVVEVSWADLGAPYAPFTGTEFRLLAGVCRTCGAFVASRNYLPPELAVPPPG